MEMEVKNLPVRYLGVHIISARLNSRDCEAIKAKILSRVKSWILYFLVMQVEFNWLFLRSIASRLTGALFSSCLNKCRRT